MPVDLNRLVTGGERPGQPVSFETFAKLQAQRPEVEVVVGIDYIRTRSGAEWVYNAELLGRKRPAVLASVMRRLDTNGDINGQSRSVRGNSLHGTRTRLGGGNPAGGN